MTIKIISYIILLFSIFILASSRAWFRYQSVGVDIHFKCFGKNFSDVRAVLYDYMTPFWNTIGSFNASEDGELYFYGKLDPYLYLYHRCGEKDPMCQTEIYIHIPKKYVYSGRTPKEMFKAQINLENSYIGQNRQCIRNGKLVKNVPYPK
uniref:Transthyretin-like family protein n=1 Tax=Strongyloides papillosus TaxID=174720 RepID=A0A0N5C066_STREA